MLFLLSTINFGSLLISILLATEIVDASPTPFVKRLSGPVSFPIHKRTSGQSIEKRDERSSKIARLSARRHAAIARIRQRYYPGSLHHKRGAKQTIPMSSFQQDNLYYATIQIGTPVQALDVQLDTGSSDLWVPISTCRNCNMSQVQPIFDNSQAAFLYNRSSTYSATTRQATVPYGDGSAITGVVATDVVSLGDFSTPHQTFIATEEEQGEFDVAGLIGLAWPSLASSAGTPWWLSVLSEFESPEISFYLADWNAPATDSIAPGGQFTLGGRNSSMYDGDIQFVPILSQDYWTIPLNSIVIPSTTGGASTTLTPTEIEKSAIIDSGSTIITGPTRMVNAFYAAVDGAVKGETVDASLRGQWLVPCATTVNAQFLFGNVTVTMPAAALHQSLSQSINSTTTNEPLCLGSLTSTGGETAYPAWIYGDSLMKSTYTVFRAGAATTLASAASTTVVEGADGPAVGFAPLKGVQYSSNGDQVLGTNGDGVDGRVGNAGASIVITGTGDGSSNSPVTRTRSLAAGTPTTTVGGMNGAGRLNGGKLGMSLVMVLGGMATLLL